MSIIDTAVRVSHFLFAGLWTGGTLLMAAAVLPAVRETAVGRDVLDPIVRRFTGLTLASVLVLFVSGGHLAGTTYTVGTLTGSGRGHLVLTMVALWLVLAGVLHVGTRPLRDQTLDVDTAVARSLPWYRGGAVVSLCLLVLAGLL
jgi:uncharacterized membrane protein